MPDPPANPKSAPDAPLMSRPQDEMRVFCALLATVLGEFACHVSIVSAVMIMASGMRLIIGNWR